MKSLPEAQEAWLRNLAPAKPRKWKRKTSSPGGEKRRSGGKSPATGLDDLLERARAVDVAFRMPFRVRVGNPTPKLN